MLKNNRRVLIVGHEDARVFALSGYLTLRGFQVDRAATLLDARALLHHLQYGAVVATVTDPSISEFLREASLRPDVVRTVALVSSRSAGQPVETLPEADIVLGSEVPVAQLARTLCGAIPS